MSDQTDEISKIQEQVAARQQEEIEHIPPPEDEQSGTGGPDDPRFVRECLNNNERGDGILYASMHRGTFLFNKIQDRWYRWEGHFWSPDIMNTSVEGVEKVALRYQIATDPISADILELTEKRNKAKADAERCKENDDLEGRLTAEAEEDSCNARIKKLTAERKKLHERANGLRGKVRAVKCMWWAHCVPGQIAVKGDEFDRHPMLLPCKNGVIDLETGRLHDGNPDDLLMRALPIEYDPNATAPDWIPFLNEIHQGDEDKTNFNRRLLGYCLTGLTVEQFLACYIGEGGNGKGTLFELMHHIMGPLAWSINPELILEQRNPRPTAGPSADIVSLYGRRLVVASETDKNRRIGAANVKRFTGEDTLVGRSPHDKDETNFKPTHKLILYTNHAPKGLTEDFALMRRLLFLEYHLRYVDDVETWQRREPQNAHLFKPKDADLPNRLRQQAPGILADLVRGCLEWQKVGGLKPPDSIVAAAEAHRQSEDHLSRFVTGACTKVDPNDRITIGEFHKAYMTWYANEISDKDRYQPSKIAVGKDLVRMGYRKESQSGQAWVYGIGLPDSLGFMEY
ncbi:MAG: hypothetical protein KAT62_00635 [Desulfuromonadales bacterium]|nr:hypothetical protein [Desulfuromonadales bacterium]